jgi:hypothetical protein
MRKRYYQLAALFGVMGAMSGGCKTPKMAYYGSPMNGNTGDYQVIPMVSDSVRTATYGTASFFVGNANTTATDDFHAGHIAISRSHNLGVVQGWYGLSLTLGSFNMGSWDTASPPGPHPLTAGQVLNQFKGPKFFGEEGFSGGMNGVWSFPGGEWRFLGFETSVNHEFGDYLRVRRQIPDSVTSLNVHGSFFATLGLTTELVRKTQDGEVGWKWAGGWVLGSNYNYLNIEDSYVGHIGGYNYFNFTFHVTANRGTFYLQADGARKAKAVHLGIVYRL